MSDPIGEAPNTSTLTLTRDPHEAELLQFQVKLLKGEVIGAHQNQKAIRSTSARMSIGTHERTELTLNDRAVSRFHAEIEIIGSRAVIRDLGSTNGTHVDGVSILASHLRDGATIDLGRTRLRFQMGTDRVKVPLSDKDGFGLLRGRSLAMRSLFRTLEAAAQVEATVLIMGETGAGKDLAAESIHREGARRAGPFVVVDCGAIAPNLLEAALFGHERGAFSGADVARTGAFEEANGGTLFLDEVGELDPDMQPKLLRALESREVKRVGASKYQPIDVRILAATNRNLRTEVNAGRFRSDLYYRLAVIELELPPLRERLDDIPLLVDLLAIELELNAEQLALVRSPDFIESLSAHPWPGNVRELRNHIEKCAIVLSHAPFEIRSGSGNATTDFSRPLRDAREAWNNELECQYVKSALARAQGNVSAAARLADVDRRYFHRLIERHKLR